MANVFSLCHDIEEFLQKNDRNSIDQFLQWIKQRLNITTDKPLINTSQVFSCQCGHQYSLRFQIVDCQHQQTLENEQRKIDELQSLEQLIPPDTTEQESTRVTQFGLPKLTDSMIEIIQTDGKRQYRCPLCFNSYVNRSGLNRHYITHSSQDLWKVGQYKKKLKQIFFHLVFSP
jgi:uncharacterized C2H2 Zn-finger protein